MIERPKIPFSRRKFSMSNPDINSQAISLTDLMGGIKFKFLNQMNCISLSKEGKFQKVKNTVTESKKSIVYQSIKSPDMIHNYQLNGVSTSKNLPINPIIDRKFVGEIREARIKHIEIILSKCDEYANKEKLKRLQSLPKIVCCDDSNKKVRRTKKRRLTAIEIRNIHKDMNKLD